MKKIIEFIYRHPVACIIALVFVCLCPIMAGRDYSPSNELRYISIVNEALRDGHVFAFYNHGIPYADKPPLYFWLIMLCRLIAGKHSMFLLCLLSAIPAFITGWIMDKWLCQANSVQPSNLTRGAMLTMLLTTGMFIGLSAFLRMDMLMVMFIVLAMHAFYQAYTGAKNATLQSWLLPLWIFLALFSKGPVGIFAPILAILVFLIAERKPKLILKYLGLRTWGVIAVLFAGWILGAYLDGGSEYVNNLLFHQTIDRAVQATEHNKPFYYYLEMILPIVLPYALMVVPMVFVYFFSKGRKDTFEKLLVCMVASTFVMLSTFSSKLAIYLLPIVPFIVYLYYPMIKITGWNKWTRAAVAIPSILYMVIGLVVVIAVILAWVGAVPASLKASIETYSFAVSPLTLIAGIIFLLGGLYAFINSSSEWRRSTLGLGLSLALSIFFLGFLIPKANPWVGYREVCTIAKEMGDGETVNTIHVRRPENMDVYLGKEPVNYQKDIDSFISAQPKGILIIKTTRINEDLAAYLEGCECKSKGDYSVFKLR